MKIYANGGRYHLHISREEEFPRLCSDVLKSRLQEDGSSRDLGKDVSLAFSSDLPYGKVDYFPPDVDFERLKRIEITLGRSEYNTLGERGLASIPVSEGNISVYAEEDMSDFV